MHTNPSADRRWGWKRAVFLFCAELIHGNAQLLQAEPGHVP